MSDLYNIQTFLKIEGSDYQPIFDKFCKFLQKIGVWNEEIKHAFDKFEWKVQSNGYVYSTITQLNYVPLKPVNIKVKPLVMIYTPALGHGFKDNWICCELVMKASDLWSEKYEQFLPGALKLIKSLSLIMHKEFPETAIYFTDEEQDEEDFHAVRNNRKNELWQFDYALIPLSVSDVYFNLPKTHRIKHHKNYMVAWDFEKWPETQS
jgi:hypothetical protein